MQEPLRLDYSSGSLLKTRLGFIWILLVPHGRIKQGMSSPNGGTGAMVRTLANLAVKFQDQGANNC